MPRQAHMQMSVGDIDGQDVHQDYFHSFLIFIQANNQSNTTRQYKQGEALKPTYLYLDLMSSFYQVFYYKYLEEVK